MSFAAVRFIINYPGLTANERLVGIIVGDRASDAGHCFPSQDYLAERSGLCVRAVRTALVGLEAKKAIRRSKRTNAAGRTSDDFLILMPRKQPKKTGQVAAPDAGTDRHHMPVGFRHEMPTIPTCPYGLGIEEGERASARSALKLVVGGKA